MALRHRWRWFLAAPSALLFALGCSPADVPGEAEPVATASEAVTNGTLVSDAENPGAVAVYHQHIRPCSGALIRRAWVLTARHCVTTDGTVLGPITAASNVRVTRAASPNPPGQANPGLNPPPGASTGTLIHAHPIADLAMVRISPEIAGPVGFWNGDAPSLQGLPVRAFGYGRSVAGGSDTVEDGTSGAGQLRRADFTVVGIDLPNNRSQLQNGIGQILNHGDSGGPSFRLQDILGRSMPGVAGIHYSPGFDNLVTSNRAFIERTIFSPGDQDMDRKGELFLTGGIGWTTIPVARPNGSGGFTVTNNASSTFASLAQVSGAKPVGGDFNGDGKADIALTGGTGWTQIQLALTTTPGNFTLSQVTVADFPIYATQAGARPLAGDFNGDGRGDLALTGGTSWSTVPVALSNGGASFSVTNFGAGSFPTWAASFNVTPVSGDFDGDGRDDIALLGGSGWGTIPVAFSNGDGTFFVTNVGVANFPTWAATPGAKPMAGDFNGDGRDDIALVGVGTWTTIPVAMSVGTGAFSVSTPSVANFPAWSATSGAKAVVGDFNGDVYDDIALTGPASWASIPVAYSLVAGGFSVSNPAVANFPIYASQSGAKALSGH